MYNIFSGIINKRLYDWAEDNFKLTNLNLDFGGDILLWIIYSVFKQWCKHIYESKEVVFIACMSIFVRQLIK